MSDWGYIGLAYGLTWTTLAVYFLTLLRRRSRALRAAAIDAAGNGGGR
jgi:hypothetical protein